MALINRSAVLMASALLLVAGCGSFWGQQSSGSDESAGHNPKPTTYTDDQYHYSIDSPGPMSRKSKGLAAYYGPQERLEVMVVEGASAADPSALADKDVSSLKSAISDFKLVAPPAPVTLADQRMVTFTYTGTVDNPATGKSIKLTVVRYYIAKNSSLLAVVIYGDVGAEFDSKEAEGFARSFRWQ